LLIDIFAVDHHTASQLAEKARFESDLEAAGDSCVVGSPQKRTRRPNPKFNDQEELAGYDSDQTGSPPAKRPVPFPVRVHTSHSQGSAAAVQSRTQTEVFETPPAPQKLNAKSSTIVHGNGSPRSHITSSRSLLRTSPSWLPVRSVAEETSQSNAG
jgi:LmbE family N-acetylglucosaminyl deacetylase